MRKRKETRVGIREFLFGKRGKDEEFKREFGEAVEELMYEVGRIKELEKKYMRLEGMIREATTDRNRLATRIQRLEYQKKKGDQGNGKDKD